MDVSDAAEALQSRLEQYDWLTSVGVGTLDDESVIYVYIKRPVQSNELDSLRCSGWMGYRVFIDCIGEIKPASV